jgi:16S rRNA (uracil1498-N3)-methyltransferase
VAVAAAAHVFVADLDQPALDAADRHHLERVLRLRTGEEITVSDGSGGWRRCAFGRTLEPLGGVAREPRPVPPITVAFAPVKGDRPEWTVQKLTELGADRIIPFVAARSVVRWPSDRARAQVERLRRIAREAASQSRRVWLPEVEELSTFGDLAACRGATLAHPDGGLPSLAPLVLVGPEGGWSDEELGAGLARMRLGAHILRAETAAVAACTLLAALRAGIIPGPPPEE